MKISYHYAEDGYTDHGEKIPDIPVVHLVIRAGKYRAHGAAIIDTGFDGGIYPNMEIVRMFEGVEPTAKTIFENPLYGASEFEIYMGEASLYYGGKQIGLGRVRVYIPTEPELLTGEVLVGREVLNNKIMSLAMNMRKKRVLLEL
ncbi:MAG: hypothetical protein QXO47_02065 [Thermoproteota archaeon]|nr:hypothetical protein [Candidatus Brockarchaeota archaeon]